MREHTEPMLEPERPTDGPLADVWVVAGLLLCGLIVGMPMWMGGWASYLDNPSHVAELIDLSNGQSWSPQGFLGFPVHQLHSPLAYGIAAWLVASGLPVGLVYCSALFMAIVAPALALYKLARQRLPPLASGLLATLLMIHPAALVGFGSVTGGMWTFHLACAALLFVIDIVARPERSARDVLPLALCLAAVAALHPMVAICAVLLALVSVAMRVARPRELLAALPWEIAAAALGALLSSGYWLPVLLSGQGMPLRQQNLAPLAVLLRLCLPTDLGELWLIGPGISSKVAYLDAIPMLLLVGAGVAGGYLGRRDPTVALAAAFAAGLLGLLVFVTPFVDLLFLGPLTWRLIWIVQLALALAATGIPADAFPRSMPQWGAVALIASLISSFPLWRDTPSAAQVDEVQRLWGWLAVHADEIPGRVYLQSTLATPPLDEGLQRSQILSRTSSETGVDQVGAWYGISPYLTGRWTPGEFGRMFRNDADRPVGQSRIIQGMTRAACSHAVVSDPDVAAALEKTEWFSTIHRQGRFTVMRFAGQHKRIVDAGDRTSAKVVRQGPGAIRVVVGEGTSPVLISEAWHPNWQVEGAGTLTSTPDGLMILALPDGPQNVLLRYRPPRELGWPALLGVLLVGALALRRRYTSQVASTSDAADPSGLEGASSRRS